MTRKDTEQLIVGTIIDCNNNIRKCFENVLKPNKKLKNLMEKTFDIYDYNMRMLYESIIDENEFNTQIPRYIELTNNNYYSYFSKVLNFLNTFELNIQQTLNESLSVNTLKIKNAKQVNIKTFKNKLKSIIEGLEYQDDTRNYSSDALSIKLFAKQPIYVCGFQITDIPNSVNDLNKINIFGIYYNRSTKEIYIIDSFGNSRIYDIKNDKLTNFEQFKLPRDKYSYLSLLKEKTEYNSIITVFEQLPALKYTDNLYNDSKYVEFRQSLNQTLFNQL